MSLDAERSAAISARLGPGVFLLGAVSLWGYVCAALLSSSTLLGIALGRGGIAAGFVAGCVVLLFVSRPRVIAPSRLMDVGVASFTITLGLLAVDLAQTVRENRLRGTAQDAISTYARASDSHVWHGEIYPRQYYPTDRNFQLYKPNVRVTAPVFGERYISSMLRSPTLMKSVLQQRTVTYVIGPEGLREVEPLSESRIFALGDSFVFGFATDEGRCWPDLLGKSLGEPIYNLGVSATGPRPQLELLKYLLERYRGSMRVRQLLWMIFEGNDLENSYDELRPFAPANRASALEGTVADSLLAIPGRIRDTSVLRKLLRGQLTLSTGPMRYGLYEVDGVTLPDPLFRSRQFGDHIFVLDDVEAATRPRDYVMNHPNRRLLDRTFSEMRALSQREAFDVTVVIAPSDARQYGRFFEGFPELSLEPYFVTYVADLSRQMGFGVVNLLEQMRPFAEREMLFYSDDHHWNERGNEVVAQLLQKAMTGHR
jgi:hypothetical protein